VEITVTPPPPPPPPPTAYSIEGLTRDELTALRDLCGRFSCNTEKSEPPHWHSALYHKINAVLEDGDGGGAARYRFYTTSRAVYDPVLRCEDA
jgi:hypothetical protein